MSQTILITVGAIVVALLAVVWIVNRLIYICPPNEVLIFSGGHRTVSDSDTTYALELFASLSPADQAEIMALAVSALASPQ